MKIKYSLILLLVINIHLIFADNTRPKIGLTLSGGGALGFAHVGILEKIDSLEIPVDYLTGTSMGGLVGALYASGWSSKKIVEFIETTPWPSLFTDSPPRELLPYFEKIDEHKYQFQVNISEDNRFEKLGLIEGQNIELLMYRIMKDHLSEKDFDKLPIPFRCISVDLLTGNEVVMKEGILPNAMRSTMSVPSIFSPVIYGDSLLIDGGVLNNMPVDIAREMGADFVLAVSVRNPNKKKENLQSFIEILAQAYNIIGNDQIHKQAENADLYIECMIEDLTPMDFTNDKAMEIVKIGRKYANRNMDKLVALKEMVQKYEKDFTKIVQKQISIDTISVYNNLSYKDDLYFDLLQMKSRTFSMDQLVDRLELAKDSLKLKELTYKIEKTWNDRNHLKITVREPKPKIFGVYVHGNKINSFAFIYRLLGIKPGTTLDLDLLEERISYLYSLGYFKKITYDLDYAIPGYIKLNLNVLENPRRTIRIGFHYDEYYDMVMAVSGKFNNFLIPGMRIEDEFILLGYTNISAKMYYPSRTLDIPVYPFIEAEYSNKPYLIYDNRGRKLAKFNYISSNLGGGVGLLWKNIEHISAYLNYEYIEARPEILPQFQEDFENYREKLASLKINHNLDLLDNYLYPKNGIRLDGYYEQAEDYFFLKSSRNFTKFSTSGDLFFSIREITLRLHGFYGSTKNAPEYKFFWIGGANSFIGVDYNQLIVQKMAYVRPEIKLEIFKNLRWSLIYNYGFNYHTVFDTGQTDINKTLSAWGSGIEYNSPLGPVNIVLAKSIQSISDKLNNKFYFYLSAGYNF
ncbi:MAG: patatin-like phospholipase family protein [Candidatus Marinimicrobia bacterium]|nr:patatin-like phospholipase family protein [Candidatus Neomarinimicrobiota bacterium]